MKKVYLTRETVYIKVIRIRKEKKVKAVSNTVWFDLKAMVTEKTIKEESTDKNYSNDNYSAFHIRDAPLSSLINTYSSLSSIPFLKNINVGNVLILYLCAISLLPSPSIATISM